MHKKAAPDQAQLFYAVSNFNKRAFLPHGFLLKYKG